MIPTQMNCPHSGDGWCLECVMKLERDMIALDIERERLADELAKARGVIDKLPKTADGVPIVPGMTVFYRHPVGGIGSVIVGIDLGYRWSCHTSASRGDDSVSFGYGDGYSTATAALAAKEAK